MTAARQAAAVALVVLAGSGTTPVWAQSVVANLVTAADPSPFTPDDLLFMEVQADGY